MTKEQDIVVRKNEENIKLTKQLEDTMKLIVGENETLAPSPTLSDDESKSATATSELQHFYARKNVLVTGGTGRIHKLVLLSIFLAISRKIVI